MTIKKITLSLGNEEVQVFKKMRKWFDEIIEMQDLVCDEKQLILRDECFSILNELDDYLG